MIQYTQYTTTTTMAIYYTRLFLELHVHVRSSYKGICSQVLIEILNWYSIDTPSTHWTIKWHLSRQSVDSRLIFYCFIWVGWHLANYQLTVDLVLTVPTSIDQDSIKGIDQEYRSRVSQTRKTEDNLVWFPSHVISMWLQLTLVAPCLTMAFRD